jgi:hypothetical protein
MAELSGKKVKSLLREGKLKELYWLAHDDELKADWLQSMANASQRDKKNSDLIQVWNSFLRVHHDELGRAKLVKTAQKDLLNRFIAINPSLNEGEARDQVKLQRSYKNVTDRRAQEFIAFIKDLKKTDRGIEYLRMLKKVSSLSESDFDKVDPIFQQVLVTVSIQLEIAKGLNSDDRTTKQKAEFFVSNLRINK